MINKTTDFISRAKTIHGDKYNYDKTVYVKGNDKVTITCPIHGDFEQSPCKHLAGRGCRKCAIDVISFSTDHFIAKARGVHGNRYDYGKVKYVNAHTKITITCPIHGDFVQTPNSHVSGSGCCKCADIETANKLRYGAELFTEKAKAVHGDKYTYEKVVYVDSLTKVVITCAKHYDFEQQVSSHLAGHGCPLCKSEAISEHFRSNTEEFIAKAIDVHGDIYGYDKVDYVGNSTKVILGCKNHGDFLQTPASHLRGRGCPTCNSSRGERMTALVLDKLNIGYIQQYVIPGNPYRYDFYLPDYNVFIEYHGIQHYFFHEYFHRNEDHFNDKKIVDYAKRRLVKLHGGKLIVIHYSFNTVEKIELFLTPLLIKLGYKVLVLDLCCS